LGNGYKGNTQNLISCKTGICDRNTLSAVRFWYGGCPIKKKLLQDDHGMPRTESASEVWQNFPARQLFLCKHLLVLILFNSDYFRNALLKD